MYSFVRRHQLTTYFLLAFGLSWAILVPTVLASYGLFTIPMAGALLLVMGYGPTFAAVIASAAIGGRPEVKALLKRLLIWRVGWGWWAVTLLLNGGIILLALALYGLTGNEVPALPTVSGALLWEIPLTFVVVALFNGEEVGWRGFALPRLQGQYGLPITGLVLGTIEAVFHLPIFFNNGASDAGGQNGMPFAAFVVSSILAVYLFAWLYANTRGSLLIATMFHASMNAWSIILPFPATSPSFFWILALAQLAVDIAIFGVPVLLRQLTPRRQEVLGGEVGGR
jgi:membrane protease YdiL (CAAX protease family)